MNWGNRKTNIQQVQLTENRDNQQEVVGPIAAKARKTTRAIC